MADPVPDASLCVACGYRDSIDGDFCGPCRERHAVAEYIAKDKPRIRDRQVQWGAGQAVPTICGNGNVVIGSGRRSSQKSRLTGTATPGSARGRPSICKAESEPASRNLAGPTDGRGGR
jgi:hypothetical protein